MPRFCTVEQAGHMSSNASASAINAKLKSNLKRLRTKKGSGTELITLIIPPDRQISDARGMLQNEHGQAANIKSKGTRKNVQAAIESAIATLNRYKTPGNNGLAIFVGAVEIGNNRYRMMSMVLGSEENPLPESLISFRYRCDSRFELDQLERMLVDNKSYGLFVIDRSEATYGLATGKRIHIQEHLVSNIMGKHRQGGQSAQRFERLIEEAAHNFFKRATEHASSYWLPNLENIQAIIVGGPGATKDFVVKNDYFHHEIQKKVAKKHLDVGYSSESGLRELVGNAGDLMGEIKLNEERDIMNRFLSELIQPHPKATYGITQVRKAIADGQVETLLISEHLLDAQQINIECTKGHNDPSTYCGHGNDRSWSIKNEPDEDLPLCPKCESTDETVMTTVDFLEMAVGTKRGHALYISIDTEEGAQLMEGFGGLAAILRYPMM